MTFPDMTVAPPPSPVAAPPVAPPPLAGAAFQPGTDGVPADAVPSASQARDPASVDDIRRAEAWLAERQIGPIV